jgi:F-type H+-transporting ATPase subunit b
MPQLETSTYLAQIVWLILCFFSLWFAMSWLILPKIDDIVKQRRNKIDDYVQKAEQTNKQALSSLERHDKALQQAHDDAKKHLTDDLAHLEQELENRRSANREALEKKTADSEFLLARQRQETLNAIDGLSLELAVDILHKVGFEQVTINELSPFAPKE